MSNSFEYQIFPEEYFSGCDVSIYMGNKWISEVVAINFTMVEQVQPVYGYNSYTYDDVAQGSRIIQGSLRINFTRANYLRSFYENPSDNSNIFLAPASRRSDRKSITDTPGISKDALKDAIMDLESMDEGQLRKLEESSLKKNLGKLQGFVDAIGMEGTHLREPFFQHAYNGGKITIVYGNPTQNQFLPVHKDIPNSYHRLVGVQFRGLAQQVGTGDDPIFEDYQFIARDLN